MSDPLQALSPSRSRVAALAALSLIATALSATAFSASPASAAAGNPGCQNVVASSVSTSTPVRIPEDPAATSGPASSSLSVSGVGSVLTDLNVVTDITHTWNNDIDMTLTSPQGTVVTLTTDNGGANDDVFAGTTWDDDADPESSLPYADAATVNLVTDRSITTNGAIPALVPEEALSAFDGENPNGTWTLNIVDDLGGDFGMLNSWSLDLRTRTVDQVRTVEPVVTGPAGGTISDAGAPKTSTTTISGAGSSLADLDVSIDVSHTSSADLDVALTSPAGTVVTLTTNNGGDADDVFAGTTFDDDADPGSPIPYADATTVNLASDHQYTNSVTAPLLAPEEALSAYDGENPNGTWTLTLIDDTTNAEAGTLNVWSLNATTGACDTAVAGATVKSAKKQRLGSKIKLRSRVSAQEAVTVRATGSIKIAKKAGRIKLKPSTRSLSGGNVSSLKQLAAGSKSKAKRSRNKIARALSQKRKVVARIAFRFTDDLGNTTTIKRKVILRR